jgi:hypothetical protein
MVSPAPGSDDRGLAAGRSRAHSNLLEVAT